MGPSAISDNPNANRCVLTLATGAPLYMQLAANLARSFRWWNKHNGLRFVIVTDHPEYVPSDVRKWVEIVELKDNSLGTGFQLKVNLDQLSPAEKTLFVDSDCLCVGDLMPVFERFDGSAFNAVGTELTEGESWGDILSIREQFNLPAVPKFNGGIYYYERSELCTQIYAKARELERRYDEIGLVRLRKQPNEEPLMAIAMAVYGQHPEPDDGTVMGDLASYPHNWECNALRGHSQLENPPPGDPEHVPWCPVGKIHPLVIHFLGYRARHAIYRREELALSLAVRWGWPAPLARAAATTFRYFPQRFYEKMKDIFRPLFHRLIGVRSHTHTWRGDPIIR